MSEYQIKKLILFYLFTGVHHALNDENGRYLIDSNEYFTHPGYKVVSRKCTTIYILNKLNYLGKQKQDSDGYLLELENDVGLVKLPKKLPISSKIHFS